MADNVQGVENLERVLMGVGNDLQTSAMQKIAMQRQAQQMQMQQKEQKEMMAMKQEQQSQQMADRMNQKLTQDAQIYKSSHPGATDSQAMTESFKNLPSQAQNLLTQFYGYAPTATPSKGTPSLIGGQHDSAQEPGGFGEAMKSVSPEGLAIGAMGLAIPGSPGLETLAHLGKSGLNDLQSIREDAQNVNTPIGRVNPTELSKVPMPGRPQGVQGYAFPGGQPNMNVFKAIAASRLPQSQQPGLGIGQ